MDNLNYVIDRQLKEIKKLRKEADKILHEAIAKHNELLTHIRTWDGDKESDVGFPGIQKVIPLCMEAFFKLPDDQLSRKEGEHIIDLIHYAWKTSLQHSPGADTLSEVNKVFEDPKYTSSMTAMHYYLLGMFFQNEKRSKFADKYLAKASEMDSDIENRMVTD